MKKGSLMLSLLLWLVVMVVLLGSLVGCEASDDSAAVAVAARRLRFMAPERISVYDEIPSIELTNDEETMLLSTAKPLLLGSKLQSHKPATQHLILAVTSKDTLGLSLNWACALKRLSISNYCFVSTDKLSHETLRGRRECSILLPLSEKKRRGKIQSVIDEMRAGTPEFHAVVGAKHLLPYSLCERFGMAVTVSDVDLIFRKDFRVTLKPESDLVLIGSNSGFLHRK